MLYILTILVMIIIMISQYKKYKYILAAPVVYPLMWILSLLGLVGTNSFFPVSMATMLVIISGYALFCAGFTKGSKGYKKDFPVSQQCYERLNPLGLNISFYLAIAVGIVYMVLIRRYIPYSSAQAMLLSLIGNKASNVVVIPGYISILAGFVRVITNIFLLYYFRNYNVRNGDKCWQALSLRNKCIVLFAISTIILFTNFSRNGLLNYLLPIAFIFIISRKISTSKIVLGGTIFMGAFVAVFAWFSFFRDSYLYSGNNYGEVFSNQFSLYLSGGVVAFDQAVQTELSWISSETLNHTFSLFASITDTLFGTSFTPEVVLNSIQIGPNLTTNVYTVYYWYALDLGIIFSILVQFVLGFMYGHFYKRASWGSFRATYWYSVLSYPLIMMYFADQYASIGQTWFTRIISYIVIATICGVSRFKLGALNSSDCF